MKHDKTLKLTYTAMLTAIVCIATMFFRVPTVIGYANLGDGFILLGAFLFGPAYGAVAGGIGSLLADVLSGYAIYAPGTLVIKGGVAIIAALLWKLLSRKADKLWCRLLAAVVAEAWMVFGYGLYETLIIQQPVAALATIPSNIAQGVVGTVVGMLLYYGMKKLPIWKKVSLYV